MLEIKTEINCQEALLADFPGLYKEVDGKQCVYLDSASTTLKPTQMVEAVCDYYLGISANIHRGKYFSLEDVSNKFEQVRSKIANLIGGSGNEIVFVSNATEALNIVSHGLNLSKDDLVVCLPFSHHSHLLPWFDCAKVEYLQLKACQNPDLEHYATLLAKNPKVVCLTHCSNVTGIYLDLEVMIAMAKEVGALVVVDAAQSIPHRRIDVRALNIDFLAFSAHKMLGPTGVGVLYGKAELLNQLKPLKLGGGMVDWVEFSSFNLRKIPHRFEAGTPNISGVLGFGAAIDYLHKIGFNWIEQHDRELGSYMLAKAMQRSYLRVVDPRPDADRGAVLSMSIEGMNNLDDLARYLSDSFGIMCRNGHLCAQPYVSSLTSGQVIRISGYIYTRFQDIDYFFDSLDELVSALL
ncbi:cysteine desulfurase [Rheinheimera sp. SA_1]|uniref:aminotransferase class V-fold PLP-dependent enzyme n=1 Tax=Rheinheimera sp. SA_1 TaxID=1827365 RepID=UPI0008001189|nr:aminotransferase class V-fold PLP-dependent enzyme [Rheinheimera sp. SA_1]OBP16547.1 cysteine desulfurase [Rheinheimera sp. SA_1]